MPVRISQAVSVASWAIAATAVAMTSALAVTTTFTLKAGGAGPGTVISLRADTGGDTPQIAYRDATSTFTLDCDSSTIRGTATTGSGPGGNAIGSINGSATTFTNCTGAFGLQFDFSGVGRWNVNALSPNAGGVTATVSGVRINQHDGSMCNFTLSGSLTGRFNNSYSTLVSTTTPSLVTSNVPAGQCFGIINNGDTASIAATYKVRSNTFSQNPVTITGS